MFKTRLLAVQTLTALTAILFASSTAASDPFWSTGEVASPTYRVLPRPLPEHQGKHVTHSTTHLPSEKANFESRAITPYTYGWFGPKASPQWVRQFGYHQRYTQWSLK